MDTARAQQILDAHNCARARYGVAPLQWDWNLADAAQKWARNCHWGHWGPNASKYPNLPAPDYGENLAASTNRASVDGWLDEEPYWVCPQTDNCRGGICGHFTQMVWKDTTRVGCAVATCKPFAQNSLPWGGEYLVCEYSPPGNMLGANVVPPAACTTRRPASDCADLSKATYPRPLVPPRASSGAGGIVPAPTPAPRPAPTPVPAPIPPPGQETVQLCVRDDAQQNAVGNLSSADQLRLFARVRNVPCEQQPDVIQSFLQETAGSPAAPPSAAPLPSSSLLTLTYQGERVCLRADQQAAVGRLSSGQWSLLLPRLRVAECALHPFVLDDFFLAPASAPASSASRPAPTKPAPAPPTKPAALLQAKRNDALTVCYRPDQADQVAAFTDDDWAYLDQRLGAYTCANQPGVFDRYRQQPPPTLFTDPARPEQRWQVVALESRLYDALVKEWLAGVAIRYHPAFIDRFLQRAVRGGPVPQHTPAEATQWMREYDAQQQAAGVTVALPDVPTDSVVMRPVNLGNGMSVPVWAVIVAVVLVVVLTLVVVVLAVTRKRWMPKWRQYWDERRARRMLRQ